MAKRPIAWILVGLPGSGKSTIAAEVAEYTNLEVVSADAYIEEYASYKKKTYTEVFEEAYPTAQENTIKDVIRLVGQGQSFLWDQTNLTVKSREKKLHLLPEAYICNAVIVVASSPGILVDRLLNRPGKHIPFNVIQDMIKSYEEPSIEEGFNIVYKVVT